MREGLNMIGQAIVCGITVIAVTIAVTIAVIIAESIRSNGITYRYITDYLRTTTLYLYINKGVQHV